VEEEDQHFPMEVEIVGRDFDVLFLLRRSGCQVLLYVLNHQNFVYRLRLVPQVELRDKPHRYRHKPNGEPQDIDLFFKP
jgi:hypothetical protein